MKHTNLLKGALVALLFATILANAAADSARVVSKQENIPDDNRGGTKSRIFLDITPNDENNRADAYVDITRTDRFMSLQEFSDMIQIGDVIEYAPHPNTPRDGRYFAIPGTRLIELNGKNIYKIFLEELEDRVAGAFFPNARNAYEAQQGRSHVPGGRHGDSSAKTILVNAHPAILPQHFRRQNIRGI